MGLREMKLALDAIELLKQAEQLLLGIPGEVSHCEADTIRLSIINMERLCKDALAKTT